MTVLATFVAASPAESPADQLSSINGQLFQYAEVLLALAGVLILAYVVLKVGLPRMLGMRAASDGPIQVLARYPLEPRKMLYLVKAGSQVFLVGTAENQVAYLTAIAPENAEELLQAARKQEPQRTDFRQWLGRAEKGREG